jgi:peptide/nickel transport system permease protein
VRRYLAGRLLQAVSVIFLVTTLTFLLVHLAPGDPLSAVLERASVSAAVRAQWREQFGLDRPIAEQYLRWLSNVSRGELGFSVSYLRPVRDVLADAIPRTMLLAGVTLVFSFALGVGVGVLQAERLGGRRDRWLGRVLLVLYSVPDFWLALVVLLLFAYKFPLLPPGGMVDPVMHDYLPFGGRVLDRLAHLVLPVLALTLLSSALIGRHQRSALMDVLPSDWMRTALAKGLSWRAAVRRHALRNALLSTITLLGLSLPTLAAGAVFVEKVFSWPGMGMMTVGAIAARDYPLITAGVLTISITVVLGGLLADLAVVAADPRVRLR